MAARSALVLLLVCAVCVSAHSVHVQSQLNNANKHIQATALKMLSRAMGVSLAATPTDPSQCFNGSLSPSIMPNPQNSDASPACKNGIVSGLTLAQATLDAAATLTPVGQCDWASQNQAWTNKQAGTCTKTYSYSNAATAVTAFKTAMNTANGSVVAMDTSLHLKMYMSMSMQGQSAEQFQEQTNVTLSYITAVPGACTNADLNAILQQIATVFSAFNTMIGSASTCLSAWAAANGVSLSLQVKVDGIVSYYTQLDSNNQPVQSSKITVQASAGNAASSLAAPAHVWLLTAAAAAALLVVGARQ